MKRLFFLSDNIDQVEAISNDIHKRGINDWHFHVVCNDERGLLSHKVHSANYLNRFDIFRSGERGAIWGLMGGIILVLLLNNFTQAFVEFGVGLALVMIIPVTMFGAWIGGLVGVNHEHYQLKQFHEAIEDGKYLIMIDVPKGEIEPVSNMLHDVHHIECQRQRLIHHWPFDQLMAH